MIELRLFILFFCLLASAFFSGLETGVISLNKLRLQHWVRRGVRGTAILQEFVNNPDHLLGTTLVGNNLCQTTFSVLAASICIQYMGPKGSIAAAVLSSVVLLVVGEYIPKAWFAASPAARSRSFAVPLLWSGKILWPVSWVITWISRALLPVRSDAHLSYHHLGSREELLHLALDSQRSGALTSDEHRMIHSVISLKGRTCDDIMIPRSRIIYIRQDASPEEVVQLASRYRFKRLPVMHIDNKTFVGVVRVLDILRNRHDINDIKTFIRPPQLAAASASAELILPRMRLTRQPMFFITDKKNDVIGMLTLSDLLDEIVG